MWGTVFFFTLQTMVDQIQRMRLNTAPAVQVLISIQQVIHGGLYLEQDYLPSCILWCVCILHASWTQWDGRKYNCLVLIFFWYTFAPQLTHVHVGSWWHQHRDRLVFLATNSFTDAEVRSSGRVYWHNAGVHHASCPSEWPKKNWQCSFY